MRARVLIALLFVWAVIATIFALQAMDALPLHAPPSARPSPSQSRQVERLQRRVSVLQEALRRATQAEPSHEPTRERAPSVSEQLRDLLGRERALASSGAWTAKKAGEIARRLYALVVRPEARLALMELLSKTGDQEEAQRILGYLLDNPFAKANRHAATVLRIRELARQLLAGDAPAFQKEAAVHVLFEYQGSGRKDVLYGLTRLQEEADPQVRMALLEELGTAAHGVPLTEEEVRPLLDRLRTKVRSGSYDLAEELSEWSDSASDYQAIQDAFQGASSSRARQAYLNAFQRGARLVEGRVAETRQFLLSVMENASLDADTRDLACGFLSDYAPWDDQTAAAVRTYHQSR